MKFQANVPFKLTKLFYEKLGEQPVNKRVLVIRDLFTAMHASIDNAVTFIDDKDACELFSKNVASNDEFGNNDTAIFVDTEINKNAWKDFIKELTNMPKFDVVIGNPPYGQCGMGSLDLHYEIAESLFGKYNEKMIFIMPGRVGFSTSQKFDKWKKKFTNVSNMDFIGNPFENVAIGNVCIFTFENHNVDKVTVKGIEYNSLFDITPFTEYENRFMVKLKSDFSKKYWKDVRNTNTIESLNNKILNFGFICSRHNGALNSRFFSSVLENVPVMEHDKFVNWIYNYDVSFKCCITHNNEHFLENLKESMKRPLLRFGLAKLQDDQNMSARVYKYIPDIDWADDRTHTDEGILEMVGFSKEESKEFAEYTKNYINKIDEKFSNRPRKKRNSKKDHFC